MNIFNKSEHMKNVVSIVMKSYNFKGSFIDKLENIAFHKYNHIHQFREVPGVSSSSYKINFNLPRLILNE